MRAISAKIKWSTFCILTKQHSLQVPKALQFHSRKVRTWKEKTYRFPHLGIHGGDPAGLPCNWLQTVSPIDHSHSYSQLPPPHVIAHGAMTCKWLALDADCEPRNYNKLVTSMLIYCRGDLPAYSGLLPSQAFQRNEKAWEPWRQYLLCTVKVIGCLLGT